MKGLEDGRLDIRLNEHKPWLQKVLRHTREHPYPTQGVCRKPSISFEEGEEERYPLRLNIVIHVVGSRGDVQPFLEIGKRLKSHGHRVRLATHLSFRETVEDQGLEFFNIGGDPAELMAFMVKNPGLMPDMRTIASGAIRKRRRDMKAIFSGCWRACYETGDGTGIEHHIPEDLWNDSVDYRNLPFVADVIIANPPSFSHLSCAEKLGIPVNIMFTMPWSATQAFPHPLANVRSHKTKPSVANFASYAVVEIMMWEGLGDLINRFRKRELGLDPLDAIRAPSIAHRLRIPYTYLWSPALLPKPLDWGEHIDVCGFSMLAEVDGYTPPDDLRAFLDAGPPPVYIGFGSIVVDNPAKLTDIVFEAVRQTGQRAIVSRGWGNIGANQADTPEIMLIDKCPHDWLFQNVSCVVHHGGAGTTAAGLVLGRPTVIVPFFGDQPFWGSIVERAGAGPEPVPHKTLTADKLAAAINKALEPETLEKAGQIGAEMRSEQGAQNAICSFYHHLDLDQLRCALCPSRPAVWWVKQSHVRLSAFAAAVLVETGLLKPQHLVLYRSQEYDTTRDPHGPLSAGAGVLYGVVTDFIRGVTELPTGVAEVFQPHNYRHSYHHHHHHRPHRHFSHGQRDPLHRQVKEWKQNRASRPSTVDSGVGSSEGRRSDELESQSRSGSGSGSEGDFAEEASNSESDTTYSSVKEGAEGPVDGTPTGDAGSPAVSKASTTDEPDEEMKELSLESTIGRTRSRDRVYETREVLIDAGYHITKAGKHLLNWLLFLPTDLTLSLSKGFHNAPKLYNDPMVQETPTVRGVRGGFRAAGTEFTQEFYQGITGLVTQPAHGLKEAGVKGMCKGVGKGIGGVFLKPAAALWGLAGYPLDGIHKTLRNSLARSKTRDILYSRITQGLGEMVAATVEERAMVLRRWNELQERQPENRRAR
ncbi:hypothetical protein P175DRAFT_0469539 [Aspergillus ochraceoroseus IBT 24754]|nr:uncharacterized protein P175DRAFT_0469539 [Aspergillus ochraceoroseus IBT 24754]PTU23988.1 hypothetical protein P175DRAFT_0469539 [Aspergillus ochraceoroseus IBT 24754]